MTGDRTFGLPYWYWAEDGERSAAAQLSAPIWARVGPPRGQITRGPLGQLRIRLAADLEDDRIYVISPGQPIFRSAGRHPLAPTLPTRGDETATLADDTYDEDPWDMEADSFRNKLEGWRDTRIPARQGPQMHNRVHVFVGAP